MDIRNTVARMVSSHRADNLIAEAQQLNIRISDLENEIHAYEPDEEGGKAPIQMLQAQHQVMQVYLQLLLARAEAEGVIIELEV